MPPGFPFTFTSYLPYNPFASPSVTSSEAEIVYPSKPNVVHPTQCREATWVQARKRLPSRPSRYIPEDDGQSSANPSPSKKRGWQPANIRVPSMAYTDVTTVTTGYLDTPSKYVEVAASGYQETYDFETEDRDQAAPPPKRRRLGEAIISTALNVALVGTAVGLTAYKLWRDRGKSPEEQFQLQAQPIEQPPPYEDKGWTKPQPLYLPPNLNEDVDPPRPKSPTKSIAESTKSTTKSPRKPRTHSVRKPRRTTIIPAISARRSSPFLSAQYAQDQMYSSMEDVAQDLETEPTEIEEQMDWMSDRLRGLIADGQKALGKEIVVQVEVNGAPAALDENEGLEDDGDVRWEDAHPDPELPNSASSTGSFRSAKGLRSTRSVGRFTALAVPHSRSTTPVPIAPPPSSFFYRQERAQRSTASLGAPRLRTSASRSSMVTIDQERFWEYPTAKDEDLSASPELFETMARIRSARGR